MQELAHNWSNGKIRNILTLEERVSVIKAYEKKPVYQKVANMFNCSSKQIKNIIANRESILSYYANRMGDGSSSEAKRRRHDKIIFLGKVMYEFLLRAQCHSKVAPVSAQTIRGKALEAKDAIKIPSFYPNNAWMKNFKTEYNISDFERPVLRSTSAHDIPSSLRIKDIIAYVSSREQQSFSAENIVGDPYDMVAAQYEEDSGGEEISDTCESGPSVSYGDVDGYEHGQTQSFHYSNTRNDNTISLESNSRTNAPPKIKKVESIASEAENSSPAEYKIKNYIDALEHLKPLEDFVLLEEDYRAIGLISQLEKVLKHNPTRNQF